MRDQRPVAASTRDEAARRLTARAAGIARAVAHVLERARGPESGVSESGASEAATFLRGWADSSTTGMPVAFRSPLDLLTERFQLTEAELDLVVLAGLPEEHEGLASTFRAMHPTGESRATAGLAALILDGRGTTRSDLRVLLAEGNAVRHGIVRLTGSGPLFERSLMLPDELWEAMRGTDAWPAGLPRVAVTCTTTGYETWLREDEVDLARIALADPGNRTLLVTSPSEQVAIGRCGALAAGAGVRLVAARIAPEDAVGRDDAVRACRGAGLPAAGSDPSGPGVRTVRCPPVVAGNAARADSDLGRRRSSSVGFRTPGAGRPDRTGADDRSAIGLGRRDPGTGRPGAGPGGPASHRSGADRPGRYRRPVGPRAGRGRRPARSPRPVRCGHADPGSGRGHPAPRNHLDPPIGAVVPSGPTGRGTTAS